MEFLILHDLNLALNFSDKVAILKKGRLVEFGQPTKIFNDKTLKIKWPKKKLIISAKDKRLQTINDFIENYKSL